MDYTVLRITSPATDTSLLLGSTFQKRGFAPVIMKKLEKISPIILEDLSKCIVDSLNNKKASDKIIEVAGKEEYTFLELRDLFSGAIGRKVRLIFIPLFIANSVACVIDSLTFRKYNALGLVSAFTGGSTCDITDMNTVFKTDQCSFKQYLMDCFDDKKDL